MTVPFARPCLDASDIDAVSSALRAGWVSGVGPDVRRFERAFADFCAARHAVAVSSGTAALHLGLASLDIGPGDEVVVPSLTFIATANAVRYMGATVVFADVDPRTWTLDPEDVERRLTSRTRAIVPVHFAGHPADTDALRELMVGRRIALIEDSAQAIGSRYKGRPTGSLGDVACFSFFANKVITTGEGGMVVTDDDSRASRASSLRGHAQRAGGRYVHDEIGFNYRMSNLQAALGLSQLRRAETFMRRRTTVGDWYRERLRVDLPFQPQFEAPWASPVPTFFGVLAPTAEAREEALASLAEHDIEARPFFDPLHLQAPYRAERGLPVTEDIAQRGLFLPCAHLTRDQVDTVVDTLSEGH